MGHMAADSLDELHEFAERIGLKLAWFQEKGELSHYDLTTPGMRRRAAESGAEVVSPRKMPALTRKMNNASLPDPSAAMDDVVHDGTKGVGGGAGVGERLPRVGATHEGLDVAGVDTRRGQDHAVTLLGVPP